MTINYRPGGASWDSGSFFRLRAQVATFEGIPDWDAWCRRGGHTGEESPLYDWLVASDVHGFFSGYQCEKMLPRFQAILTFLGDRLSDYDRSNLEALVGGMQHCAEHGCAMSWG